jgi:hypothetical protein
MFLFILIFVILVAVIATIFGEEADEVDVVDTVKDNTSISFTSNNIIVSVDVICPSFYISNKSLPVYKADKILNGDEDGDHKIIIYISYYCAYEEIHNIDWSPIEVVSDPDDEYDCYNTYREHKTKRDFKAYTIVKVWDDPIYEEEDLYLVKPNRRVRTHYEAPRKTRRDYKKNHISKRDVAEMLWEE